MLLRIPFIAILLLVKCGSAGAGWYTPPRVWDDLSWWGNSGATPEPVKDESRAGYWWYPTEPASNTDDTELWGNRGKIFHTWTPPLPLADTPKPAPRVETPFISCPGRLLINNILFDFDKSVLKPDGKPEADKLVEEMKKWPKDTLVLEGHTDNVGNDEYNMALGERRAIAVKKYMVEQGVDAARITVVSKGESEPVVPNERPVDRKLNRRVVFKYSFNE